MVKRGDFWHTFHAMNLVASLPLALLHLSPAAQTLVLFSMGWALIMFLVLHLDGTRAR
jgi:hypothetical protein